MHTDIVWRLSTFWLPGKWHGRPGNDWTRRQRRHLRKTATLSCPICSTMKVEYTVYLYFTMHLYVHIVTHLFCTWFAVMSNVLRTLKYYVSYVTKEKHRKTVSRTMSKFQVEDTEMRILVNGRIYRSHNINAAYPDNSIFVSLGDTRVCDPGLAQETSEHDVRQVLTWTVGCFMDATINVRCNSLTGSFLCNDQTSSLLLVVLRVTCHTILPWQRKARYSWTDNH